MIEDYLVAVDSVVKRLFEARIDYEQTIADLFALSFGPIFTFNRNNSQEVIEQSHAAWSERKYIQQEKELVSLAVSELGNEQFALSMIDGSLLQIAYKGIDLYSENTNNDSPLNDLSSNLYRFSVGKKIERMPSGLIIYAGRNHYNHLEDGEDLRKPTKQVISYLKDRSSNTNFEFNKFTRLPSSLTTNFVYALGWNSAQDFKAALANINEI